MNDYCVIFYLIGCAIAFIVGCIDVHKAYKAGIDISEFGGAICVITFLSWLYIILSVIRVFKRG